VSQKDARLGRNDEEGELERKELKRGECSSELRNNEEKGKKWLS